MFGFYSFSEKPFSAAAVATAGVTHEGQANLQASATLTASANLEALGSKNLESNGTIQAAGSVVVSGKSSLSSTATITGVQSTTVEGASLLVDSGTTSANGTLLITGSSLIEASGEISTGVVKLGAVSITSSGNIVSNNSLIITSDTALSSSGEFTSAGKVFKTSSVQITSSGTLSSIGTFDKITGSSTLESSATIVAAPLIRTATLSASGSIAAQIGLIVKGEAEINQTGKEFLTKTSRPNYKPALPKLSNKDIVLDFPFYEGAGPYIHSVTSRSQKAALNGLEPMWRREDGIQSLYSPGATFNNYRITTDTTGIKFDKAGIILRFKPTRNTTAREFLFTIRGTANNNNEIDCYTRTANGKVYVKVYNGTSEQALEIPNLVVNEWNTLVITWGSGDLKGSLNGNEFSTYSSVTVPHATLVGKTLYLYGTSSDTLVPQGYIGAFRWYNRELSIIEAKQLHKNIYQDYSLDYIIPHHYETEISRVTSSGTLLKHGVTNISGSGQITGHGSFLFAQLKSAFGGQAELTANGIKTDFATSTASLEGIATVVANGLLLGELDIVPFTMFINKLEDYNIDVYRNFVKEFNVARTKAISTSIEQTKITGINIDKILETGLEK